MRTKFPTSRARRARSLGRELAGARRRFGEARSLRDAEGPARRGQRLSAFAAMTASVGAYQEALLAARSVAQAAANWWSPRLRLGVTGLSRSGKTIFITALVQALVAGGRLPMFAAQAEGRISRVRLTLQPDDAVPRFPYEENLAAMSGPDRRWPESTRRISELSIEIEYESAASWFRGARRLTLDIVDYPGEWLLDLPLIEQSYAEFSRMSLAAAREPARASIAAEWRAVTAELDARGQASEDEGDGGGGCLSPLSSRGTRRAARLVAFAALDVSSCQAISKDRPRSLSRRSSLAKCRRLAIRSRRSWKNASKPTRPMWPCPFSGSISRGSTGRSCSSIC